MVGYTHNETLTPNQKIIAGCVSGCLTRFITQPLDVIKVRTQLAKKKKNPQKQTRFFKFTRKIFTEEGFKAFWAGHALGQIHSIASVSCQFYVYEMLTRYVHEHNTLDKKYKPISIFLCGALAGCASTTLVIPLEVIRVRQMIARTQYGRIWHGAKLVYQSGGILAFYEGLGAAWLQVGPAVAISFTVFALTQKALLKFLTVECKGKDCDHAHGNVHSKESLVLATTIAGCTAGFVSKTLTYPFDLAKRRLQIASHTLDNTHATGSTSKDLFKCKSLVHCIEKTVKQEGFRGLFRGWKITIYKAQITSVVTFTTYELVCYAIREFNVK